MSGIDAQLRSLITAVQRRPRKTPNRRIVLREQCEADVVVALARCTSPELAVKVSKQIIRLLRRQRAVGWERGYNRAKDKFTGRRRAQIERLGR